MSDEPQATRGLGLGTLPEMALPSPSMLDTNVLVSSTASRRTLHGVAQSVVRWASSGGRTCVSGQILREYLVVATRPPASNGLGLAPVDATANVSAFRSVMRCLDENDEVQEKLAELVQAQECRGVVIHDANIVATALVHGVPAIVTENEADFRQFDQIVEV